MSEEALIENPSNLIRETRTNFSIVNDTEALSNISKNLNELQRIVKEKLDRKSNELSQSESALEKNEARLDTLRRARTESGSGQLQGGSSEDVLEMARELESLERRLVELRQEVDRGLEQLIEKNADDGKVQELEESQTEDPEHRTNVLKIQLYRSLGVVLDADNNRALISKDGTLDVVPVGGDASAYFRTKYLWDRI
ncbi:kinetochore-associated Ndc80 complex subunit SPC24 [Lachancea thermotolerans CBS 6340]|uniref:Kinetochore protein Spc24 n=1 Tax=Lachancea thermotolerans (strain ATCC 56472 / CBS 6340 / NRRL Y-8284) TaxID=559295 RepID=C5DGD3_LACTC|nr:KLTH0D04378p [Lachancea thermotolerans CBS 6340]CAR22475.1 KLTH0D04378p [Lachancea thermotolerans CBS 6340]